MNPQRIQLRRTKGWRKPEGAIVVSRPSGWGNPYRVGDPFVHRDAGGKILAAGVVRDNAHAVRLFRAFLDRREDMREMVRAELAGHDLACWCKPGDPCHADVLLELANGGLR